MIILAEQLSAALCRDHFYQFGEIRSITMVGRQQCAFVQFTSRSSAEAAAEKSFNKLILQVRIFTIQKRNLFRMPTGQEKEVLRGKDQFMPSQKLHNL